MAELIGGTEFLVIFKIDHPIVPFNLPPMEGLFQMLSSIHPMSEALTDYLFKTLKERRLAKKDFLLRAGHISRNIYFIQSGLLRCFYERNGKDVSSWFMMEGDVIIGVESFFRQVPSVENIQALEDTVMFGINYDELQHTFRSYPEFNFIGRVVTEQYYTESEKRLYSIRMQRGLERYQYLLEKRPELIHRVPSKYLATYLGMTVEYLSRIKAQI